jgi:hypothetical protein
MGFKGRLFALGALALAAFATAPPAVAATASHAFSVSARSGELCPSVVAIVANDVAPAAIVATPEPHRRASASEPPRLFAATLIVGFGFAAAPGAPAPFDPGRLSIA